MPHKTQSMHTHAAVLDTIKAFPDGILSGDVADLMTGQSRTKTMNSIQTLVEWDCVSVEMTAGASSGRSRLLRYARPLSERVPSRWHKRTSAPARSVTTAPEVVPQSARDRIAELEAWKAAAIARYPDLAVAPEVLEARNLVADMLREDGDKLGAAEVLAGRRDHTPLVRVTLRALGGE